MVNLPIGMTQCGDGAWIGTLLTGVTARKWLWTPLRNLGRQDRMYPCRYGGAVPSDMNGSCKRETDPIAFEIHFATGAHSGMVGVIVAESADCHSGGR
ncbi:MAG: hypothetical protein A4C66_04645 [Nitrospira sp. HN-bin3]|nr:MAG: hypothetical protein A4C66_04645 [Nitrospira sp. HN-bin3]